MESRKANALHLVHIVLYISQDISDFQLIQINLVTKMNYSSNGYVSLNVKICLLACRCQQKCNLKWPYPSERDFVL